MSAKDWEIRLQVNPQSRTAKKDSILIPSGLKIETRGVVCELELLTIIDNRRPKSVEHLMRPLILSLTIEFKNVIAIMTVSNSAINILQYWQGIIVFFTESSPRLSTSERGIGAKNKVYWAVRTLSDGTKIRHKISPDDPLLKRVPITKLRKSVSASSSSSKLSAAEEAIAASSFSIGGHARMSPPRQWSRTAETPRSAKASSASHSRSMSNRHREAMPASASPHVTRGGHAKISPPKEEPSGKKRSAAEALGGRKRWVRTAQV